MELLELRELDSFGAFSEFITMEEAKNKGLIPSDIASYFPNKCKCGSDMIISSNLKVMMCCDPLCYIKQGYSLLEFLRRGDIKGIGPAACLGTAQAFYKSNPNRSYLNMIYTSLDKISAYGNEGVDIEDAIKYIVKQSKTFATIVSSLGIPKLGTRVIDVLKGLNTPNIMLQDIVYNHNGSVSSFLESRGVSDTMFKFYFKFYLNDIVYVTEVYENMIREAMRDIKICITGSLSPNGVSLTRPQFIKYCNTISVAKDGNRLFEIQDSSAIKSVNYLICDYPSSSSKYQTAAEREKLEQRKIIYTSTEFLNLIEQEVKAYDRIE